MSTPDEPGQPSAVALRYHGDGAPVVTAKGDGELARQILELAREHHIPMRNDPRLVELLAQVPVGDEIPRELYVAVAQVLVFVYALTGKAPGAGPHQRGGGS